MRLSFITIMLFAVTACGPSVGQLCADKCGDMVECAGGIGTDVLGCQQSCEATADTDDAYVAYLECVYELESSCSGGGECAELYPQ